MSFATWGGKPYLVAAYTCTPIVTIPLDELKDGAHIRGKTIAELGYGNTPADLIAFTKTDQGKTEDFLLLVNFERGSSIIPVVADRGRKRPTRHRDARPLRAGRRPGRDANAAGRRNADRQPG